MEIVVFSLDNGGALNTAWMLKACHVYNHSNPDNRPLKLLLSVFSLCGKRMGAREFKAEGGLPPQELQNKEHTVRK